MNRERFIPLRGGKLLIPKSEKELGERVTLSLATAAENGEYSVICCDGRLVFGKDVADVNAPKFQLFGDWVFMFAGQLASTDLIVEEIRLESLTPRAADSFKRENIVRTVLSAFNKRVACWAAIRNVSMFDMDATEFKDKGPKIFGPKLFREFAIAMHTDAQKNFQDQLMIVGWGKTKKSVLIHSIGIAGDKSHNRDGHGAIGSGRYDATSALVKFGHALHSSLQDSLYMAIAAKFCAESKLVGKDTSIIVTRGRRDTDPIDNPIAIRVQPDQIQEFRKIWKRNRNRWAVPVEARQLASEIVKLTNDEEVINRGSLQLMESALKQSTPQKSKQAK